MVLFGLSAAAQERETSEHAAEPQGEGEAHEEHGEEGEHHGHAYHPNEVGFFTGVTNEKGHDAEFSIGFEYERRLSQRWGIGGLFEYTDGLRNRIFAVPVYWHPGGGWKLIAAPGVEHHDGRGVVLNPHKSDGPVEIDEDETYFLFRLGAAYDIHLGGSWGLAPGVNLDFVEGERVLVYGVSLTYGF
jgi:hypothetical protein